MPVKIVGTTRREVLFQHTATSMCDALFSLWFSALRIHSSHDDLKTIRYSSAFSIAQSKN